MIIEILPRKGEEQASANEPRREDIMKLKTLWSTCRTVFTLGRLVIATWPTPYGYGVVAEEIVPNDTRQE